MAFFEAPRDALLLAVASLLVPGCQCSLDTSAIDDLRCRTTDDCAEGLACREGYCQAGCDPACGPGQSCTALGCVCDDPGLAACGAACVRTSSEPAHCGACDRACGAEQVCQQGECAAECADPLENCGGACVDWLHDRLYCGNCETRCEGADVCLEGVCGTCVEPADCADGLDCTADDCRQGVCTNEVADGWCRAEGVCIAAGQPCSDGAVCAPCAGGCALPPTSLTVSCDETRAPGDDAVCNITVDEPTEAACLSCTALAGMTELVRETFDDCDPARRGWIVSEPAPICPLEQGALFPGTGAAALEADAYAWSIERRVDTTGFDTVRLCFDFGQRGADANSELQVMIDTGGGWEVVFADTEPILATVEPAWITRCLGLGAAAANRADLGIQFALGAADGRDVYVDDVFVGAWEAADLAADRVIDEDFTDCAYDDWTVEGERPNCATEAAGWAGIDALEAIERGSDLSRRVDRPLCEDPWLVFAYGASNSDHGEPLTVDLDTGGGWSLAWGSAEGIGADSTFTEIRLGLALLDPASRDNPDLWVRFGLFADGGGRAIAIDDVVLEGMSCGPAGDRATLSEPTRVTDSAYSFAVSADRNFTVHPVCTWGANDAISGRDRVTFRQP